MHIPVTRFNCNSFKFYLTRHCDFLVYYFGLLFCACSFVSVVLHHIVFSTLKSSSNDSKCVFTLTAVWTFLEKYGSYQTSMKSRVSDSCCRVRYMSGNSDILMLEVCLRYAVFWKFTDISNLFYTDGINMPSFRRRNKLTFQ